MRSASLGRLVSQSLWRSRGTLSLAGFGVAVGIAALSFFLALSEGLRAVVGQIFPTERLVVIASGGEGGALSLFGGSQPASLTNEDLERVRAIAGVADAQPRMRLSFPIKAWGGEELLKSTGSTELIGDGVPASLVDDLEDPTAFGDMRKRSSRRPCRDDGECPREEYCDTRDDEPRCEQMVPALVSPFVLEMYNNYLAPGGGLPRMSRWMFDRFRGFTFHVKLGQSFVGKATCGGRSPCTPRTIKMRLAGMSRHAVDLGITVPIEYVSEWNSEYGDRNAGKVYSSLSLRTVDDDDVTPVIAELRRFGYETPSNRAQQAGVTITIITVLLALTSSLIILVAAINIAHTFFTLVHERRHEIGLYRAIGATRSDVRNIILAEAAFVGMVSGVMGMVLAVLAAWTADAAWERYVPNFPFKPESLFSFTPALVATALAFAVGGCLLGAYLPSRRAARLDPARALT